MNTNSEQFYQYLTARSLPLGDLLLKTGWFKRFPDDWQVIITDIKGSTKAVSEGRHENVNLIATGSIVAVLNIAYAQDLTIPFFFGGDGATFIIPPLIFKPVMQALVLYQKTTLTNFSLELRTGSVSIGAIYAQGEEVMVSKYQVSEKFSIPVVLGNGLAYAERLIKGEDYLLTGHSPQEEELNLEGMQCRWDRISPPEDKEEVVTLLVIARSRARQAAVFSKVICQLDGIYGLPLKRQPISIAKLKLKSTFKRLGSEMRARIGKIKPLELLQNWLTMLYGYIYFRTERGKYYLQSMVKMSDTLVLDGKINTVISGSIKQREALQKILDQMEQEGELFYGVHSSQASIMSCYVRDLVDGHIHFVDGSEGGYTQAARMLKSKFSTH